MGLRIRALASEGSGEEESLRDSSVEKRTWVQSRRMTALGPTLTSARLHRCPCNAKGRGAGI